jgi:tetratricopeptide (TPR) repeat protein
MSYTLGADDMEKLQWLIRADRYDEADQIIHRRLATHPDDALALAQQSRLLTYRAEQFRDLSRLDEAWEIANRAVSLAPNEALPFIARSNAYRIKQEYEKALADATTAVQRDPHNVMAHVIRGFCCHHLHDLEGMRREAEIGMEIDPEFPEARATYVAYLFAKGRLAEGMQELDRAIAITPDMAALYFLKGYGFEKQRQHADAVAQYTLAIQCNNQIPGYYCRRAISHANGGNVAAAQADIAAAERIRPDYVDIASARAMVNQRQRGYGTSGDLIVEGLKQNPRSADLWQGRGFDLYNNRRFAEAIDAFDKCLEINPSYGEAHMGIGMVHLEQNRYDDALVHLNRATRHKPHLGRAHFEKSRVWMAKGDLRQATEAIDLAIQSEPQNPAYRIQKATIVRAQP